MNDERFQLNYYHDRVTIEVYDCDCFDYNLEAACHENPELRCGLTWEQARDAVSEWYLDQANEWAKKEMKDYFYWAEED